MLTDGWALPPYYVSTWSNVCKDRIKTNVHILKVRTSYYKWPLRLNLLPLPLRDSIVTNYRSVVTMLCKNVTSACPYEAGYEKDLTPWLKTGGKQENWRGIVWRGGCLSEILSHLHANILEMHGFLKRSCADWRWVGRRLEVHTASIVRHLWNVGLPPGDYIPPYPRGLSFSCSPPWAHSADRITAVEPIK
jgi:hypothetical protein